MATLWKLRILNTRHAGAEVLLQQPVLLGRNEEHADIVIDADFVSSEFVYLHPSEEGVRVELRQPGIDIVIDGEVFDASQPVPPQKVLQIGELALAVRPQPNPSQSSSAQTSERAEHSSWSSDSGQTWAEDIVDFDPEQFAAQLTMQKQNRESIHANNSENNNDSNSFSDDAPNSNKANSNQSNQDSHQKNQAQTDAGVTAHESKTESKKDSKSESSNENSYEHRHDNPESSADSGELSENRSHNTPNTALRLTKRLATLFVVVSVTLFIALTTRLTLQRIELALSEKALEQNAQEQGTQNDNIFAVSAAGAISAEVTWNTLKTVPTREFWLDLQQISVTTMDSVAVLLPISDWLRNAARLSFPETGSPDLEEGSPNASQAVAIAESQSNSDRGIDHVEADSNRLLIPEPKSEERTEQMSEQEPAQPQAQIVATVQSEGKSQEELIQQTFLTSASQNSASQTSNSTPDSLPAAMPLQSLLNNPAFAKVTVSEPDYQGRVTVSGYVFTDTQRSALQQQLNRIAANTAQPANTEQSELSEEASSALRLSNPYHFKVYSQQQMQESARLILANLGLSALQVETGDSPGSLVAHITGDNITQWRRAENVLLSDIPGLQSWKTQVALPLDPVENLSKMLRDFPWFSRVKLESVDAESGDEQIQVQARLSNNHRSELLAVFEQFHNRYGNRPELVHVTPPAPVRVITLGDLGIAAVRQGKNSYVTHTNGNRYLVGARLPNGDSLHMIADGELTIVSGVRTIQVRYDNHTKQSQNQVNTDEHANQRLASDINGNGQRSTAGLSAMRQSP